MGRDRVGEEGVDHDHVPAAARCPRGSAARRRRRPAGAGRAARRSSGSATSTTTGSSSTASICSSREVAPQALRRRAGAEADVEHAPRVRVVRDPEVEEVGVAVARPERVVDVHRALQRVVEAQVARVRVLDHRQPVVARVLGEDDLRARRAATPSARSRASPVAVAVQPVERRPVPRRGRRSSGSIRCVPSETAYDARRDGEHERRRPRPPAAAPRAPTSAAVAKSAAAPNTKQLLDAELRDQPERGHERAGDAAGGRDREGPPGRRGPTRRTACTCSRTAIGPTAESSTLIGPKSTTAHEHRIEPRARIPGEHPLDHRRVDAAGSRAPQPRPRATTAASVSGDGKRSARAPPSQ